MIKTIDELLLKKRKLLGKRGFGKWRYEMADMIRDKLLVRGIALQDWPDGTTTWKRVG